MHASRLTLAVDAARRRSIRAVRRAAHAVEKVGLLALAVEPHLRALTRRHRHRLASRQLDLRAVRGKRAHVPLEAVLAERMRRDCRVDALVPVRRVLAGVVHVVDEVPTSLVRVPALDMAGAQRKGQH